MNFLDSERVKQLIIGAAKYTAQIRNEVGFNVCKDNRDEIFTTELYHGDRHRTSTNIHADCPDGTEYIANIHTHPPFGIAEGRGAPQSQARLSTQDVMMVGRLNRTHCVSQLVKQNNEVVVKCLTPDTLNALVEKFYAQSGWRRSDENTQKAIAYVGWKMRQNEEASRKYTTERRFKL